MRKEDVLTESGKTRIVQELVPGKQITIAHLIANPDQALYEKLGIALKTEQARSAIGIITISPGETAVIAADIAVKSSGVELGFVDRFNGTLIITGNVADVDAAIRAILSYVKDNMDFAVCNITKT